MIFFHDTTMVVLVFITVLIFFIMLRFVGNNLVNRYLLENQTIEVYSDFLNIEFDSFIVPGDQLELGGFRLLDVDNRCVLPFKYPIRVLTTSMDFVLMPFMVIIESIRLVIRPITLSIRLTANMIAGHLLLSLLGSSGVGVRGFVLLFLLFIVQIMLFVLEIFVSLIQAYVFSILSALYRRES
ncbi:ATP synthase subunit a [Trachymyrmex zeteki]|uniref:Cytochrome c oxidase polypeptide II n=1 Tax=Mycetomoellerius zeteki TaxID=64791 RepID=A0A151WFI9_9HYME|nr:ATP synthase subunit a [Trachymyrmex zeteki]